MSSFVMPYASRRPSASADELDPPTRKLLLRFRKSLRLVCVHFFSFHLFVYLYHGVLGIWLLLCTRGSVAVAGLCLARRLSFERITAAAYLHRVWADSNAAGC